MNLILALILWLSTPGTFADVPEFKGGQRGLNLFIARNMLYPEYAKQNCLQGTINVSFKLTKKGKIFESKIQKGFGVDLDIEALRIVRLTWGLWKVPAAFETTQSIIIPINFALKEYNCNERSADDIRDAITAYKAKQDLTKAVINFYDKRAAGSYSAEDEARIFDLKQQLGYDDRFFDRTIRQAQQKLRQGDKESACEDLNLVRKLGSDKADQILAEHCR